MASAKPLPRSVSRITNWKSWTLRRLSLFSLILAVFISTIHYHRLLFLSSYFDPPWNNHYPSIVLSRPIIARDEFFHKGPSIDEINDFFRFDVNLYTQRFAENKSDSSYFQLQPLWTTNVSSFNAMEVETIDDTLINKRKLIFIHTSRTAGSTIRAVLLGFASQYPSPLTLLSISRCFDLSIHFMEGDDRWRNGRYSLTDTAGSDCLWSLHETLPSPTSGMDSSTNHSSTDGRWKPTRTYSRTNTGPNDSLSSAFLQDTSVNIIAGQVPLGCDEFWYSKRSLTSSPMDGRPSAALLTHPVHAQYVIFFRHPLDQFVSEFMLRKSGGNGLGHANDTLTVDDAIRMLRETLERAASISHEHEPMYWEPTSAHAFIAPRQMEWVERFGVSWSPERRVNVTLSNLLQHDILVGLVERMPESLSMLQYLLDPEKQMSAVFQFFTSEENVSHLANVATLNRTNEIVDRIRHDRTLLSMVEQFIQHEMKIYSLAKQIHERQYRWLQQNH
jgi:hypothetical protein